MTLRSLPHFLGGSYLLSQLLLPQLKASASEQPRVVFVTPVAYAHYETSRLGDGHQYTGQAKYDGNFAYGYAKLSQVLLAAIFKGREPTIKKWVTAHPGWSGTNAVEDAFGANKKYLEPLRTSLHGREPRELHGSCTQKILKVGHSIWIAQLKRNILLGPS